MILMDEENTTIKATIKYNYDKHAPKVKEGGLYFIQRFPIYKNDTDYKVTNHNYKIFFHATTAVTVIEDINFPTSCFNFVGFEKLKSPSYDLTFLCDVIGQVVGFSDVDMHSHKKTLTLDLCDEKDNHMTCKLWEGYAEQIYNFISNHKTNDAIIIVIQFAKAKVWQGHITLSNTMYASRLFVNPDFPEVKEFIERFTTIKGDCSIQLTEAPKDESQSLEHIFLENPNVVNVRDLPFIKEEGTYVVLATIKAIDPAHEWFYKSCHKCLDGITKDNLGNIMCPSCKTSMTVAYPRYKLVLKVADESDRSTFVLFDNLV
ncbi:unnamed protein product [Amaranthus hypochondriacus]